MQHCQYKVDKFHRVVFSSVRIPCHVFLDETIRVFGELLRAGRICLPNTDPYADIQDYLEVYGITIRDNDGLIPGGVEVVFVNFNRPGFTRFEQIMDSVSPLRLGLGSSIPPRVSFIRSVINDLFDDPEGEYTELYQTRKGTLEIAQEFD